MITIAIPKGRLQSEIAAYFSARDIKCQFSGRQLISENRSYSIRWILVKNSDVPLYVSNGTAALGIVGSDILREHERPLFCHLTFPFGKAKMCLINMREEVQNELHNGVKIASKYVNTTRNYLLRLGISGSIYPLNGSLELAPLLGLASFIIDIVQSGKTIESNNLKICEEITPTEVYLVSNPAYYKVYHTSVDKLIAILQR